MMSHAFSARPAVLVFAAVLIAGTAGAPASAALSKEDSLCRRYLGTRVRVLADTIVNEGRKCNRDRSRGRLDPSVDCNDPDSPTFPGLAKVARAADKVADIAAKKCSSGVSTPSANGYASCPTPCDTAVPSITSYDDVAACLVCLAKSEASTALDAVYGSSPAIQSQADDAWRCQNSYIGPEIRSYIKKRVIEQQKCQYKEDRGSIGSLDCQTADLTGAIGKKLAKLQAEVDKCSDQDLAVLTSCSATSTTEELSCLSNAAVAMADALFTDVYPEPSVPVSDCAADNLLDVSGAPGPGTGGGVVGNPVPQVSGSCDGTTVTVHSNGIPTYQYINITPNGLQEKSYSFTFPQFPAVAASPTNVPLLGTMGVAVNGVPLFGVNEGPQPASDAYGDPAAAMILDECGSHSAQQGTFHIHKIETKCLLQSEVTSFQPWNDPDPSPSEPSPIVGYAFDGFPIYGPYECTDASCTSVQEMRSAWDSTNYETGTVGCASSAACSNGYCADVMINGTQTTACVPRTCVWSNNAYTAKAGSQYLDQCNGHVGPNGDYHYHATATFPYILGCYRGTPTNNGGMGVQPGGSCPTN